MDTPFALADLKPAIVNFHTEDYAPVFAKHLGASLERCGFAKGQVYISTIKGGLPWTHVCAMKALFCAKAAERLGRPIIWLDADAEIVQPDALELFNILSDSKTDVSCYRPDPATKDPLVNSRLLSGTVFFNYTPQAAYLLAHWSMTAMAHPDTYDQESLFETIERRERARLIHFTNLPRGYVCIPDLMPTTTPIITHHQASRTMKDRVDAAATTRNMSRAEPFVLTEFDPSAL